VAKFVFAENIRGIVMLAIFVFLVAGLFFIPEIINLQHSALQNSEEEISTASENEEGSKTQSIETRESLNDKKNTESVDKSESVESERARKYREGEEAEGKTQESSLIEERNESGVIKRDSNLEKIERRIESGFYDFDPDAYRSNTNDPRIEERELLMKLLDTDKLTWDILRKKEVIDPVKRTIGEAKKLLKAIDPKKAKSKFALINFVNALNYFTTEEVKQLSPNDALSFLGNADREVTEALINESVNRTEYNIWKAISLGPLVVSSGAERMKQKYTPAFYSDIVLTSVKVIERYQVKGTRRITVWDIDVTGYVLGLDALDLQIYTRGNIFKVIELPKNVEKNRRKFSFSAKESQSGFFVLRAVDEQAGFFEKSYSLVSGARKYPKSSDGSYKLPEYTVLNDRENIDRKIDYIFMFGSPRGAVAGGDYSVFTQNSFSGDGNTFNTPSGQVTEF
jgi:hypothetical protein